MNNDSDKEIIHISASKIKIIYLDNSLAKTSPTVINRSLTSSGFHHLHAEYLNRNDNIDLVFHTNAIEGQLFIIEVTDMEL